jgi:archaellum component FlaC
MIDFSSDNGSLGQIAKLKAGIRKIADETGETFINAQNEIKKQSGLYDEVSKEYKSFGNCSKEELSSAIQIMIEVGKFISVDLS